MTRRQALLLRAFCVWTVYVFLTLIYNISRDHAKGQTGFGFKAVHFVLAAISITLAVSAWRVVTAVAGRRAVRGDKAGAVER